MISSASPKSTRKSSWSASQWYIAIGSSGRRSVRLIPSCVKSVAPSKPAPSNSHRTPRPLRSHHCVSRALSTNQPSPLGTSPRSVGTSSDSGTTIGRMPRCRQLAPLVLTPLQAPKELISLKHTTFRGLRTAESRYAACCRRDLPDRTPGRQDPPRRRRSRLLRHRVDVFDVEVNQGVRPRIALVFRQVDPNVAARYGDKPREARLKLVRPLLTEPQALIPHDSPIGVLDTEDRHDLLIHAVQRKRCVPGGYASLSSLRVEQHLDRPPAIHRVVPSRRFVERQLEIEHLARVDQAVPDQVDKLGEEASNRCRATVEMDMAEEELVASELDVVRHADVAHMAARAGGANCLHHRLLRANGLDD